MPSEPATIEQRLERVLDRADEFFMKTGSVHRAAASIARRLDDLDVPYAIAGALALAAHGHERLTADVGVLLTRDGLAQFKRAYLGRGYVETPGSRGIRDTEEGVQIDVLLTGDFPGDGLAKPVAFPDPAAAAIEGDRFRVLALPRLIELKIASGMTAPHRLRDLADVIDLVRAAGLPEALADDLDPYVREKYLALWQAAQGSDPP